MTDPRQPIGPYDPPTPINAEAVALWIDEIERLPSDVRLFVARLEEAQLDTTYREGGWTVRQVIHHLADSHMNSYVRFKWALTEDRPTIKAYDENAWAQLPDSVDACVGLSMDMLDTLHARWVELLVALTPTDLASTYIHPESGEKRLDWTIGAYAWHGRHHLAQVMSLAERQGWVTA